MSFYLGTAGWTIPNAVRDAFPPGDSALARYAGTFQCVEINSSFYRPHRRSTYERWAATVPGGFRFSLKVPKAITHERKLIDCGTLLQSFLDDTSALGEKLGVYVVQLAPSHVFEKQSAAFFRQLRDATNARIACEPRHPSWLSGETRALLGESRITIAGADPVRFEGAAESIPYGGFAYYRWHGSPRTYYSAYGHAYLERFANQAKAYDGEVWCIFDNTALGEAAANALAFRDLLG